MSNSSWPHGPQHTRLPCPSLSARVCLNSCPLSQWCYLTVSSSASPSFTFNLSSIRVFSSESALCIRWPKYWSFSISPSNEYSGLIYFKIDWVDLLEVQGTLKSLLQHHNSFIQLTFIFPCRGLNPVHGAYSSHMKDPIFHLFHLSVLLTPVNAISPHTEEKEKVPYVIHVGIQEADCAYDHKFLLSLEPNGPQRRSTST